VFETIKIIYCSRQITLTGKAHRILLYSAGRHPAAKRRERGDIGWDRAFADKGFKEIKPTKLVLI
jgi:hypothetical protein